MKSEDFLYMGVPVLFVVGLLVFSTTHAQATFTETQDLLTGTTFALPVGSVAVSKNPTSATWVPSSGGPIPWSTPTNALLKDQQLATSTLPAGQTTGSLRVSGFDFSLPQSAIITSVQVIMTKGADTPNGITTNNITLVTSGGSLIPLQSVLGGLWASGLGSTTDLVTAGWNLPEGSPSPQPLTRADLIGIGFGVMVSAKNPDIFPHTANVDHVSVIVTYTTSITPPASPPLLNSIAYVGCSNTALSVAGYAALPGQEYFWPSYNSWYGSIDSWTNTNSTFWQSFDQMSTQYGSPRVVWVQLCEPVASSTPPSSYNAVKQLFANLKSRVPDALVLVSAITAYQPAAGLCSLMGPSGEGETDTITWRDQAIKDGLAWRGPDTGPLNASTVLPDNCHPTASGQQLIGNQLRSFFTYDANGNLPAAVPPPDTESPSVPSGLAALLTGAPNTIHLAWTASTDNVAVTGYQVYRNDSLFATTSASSFSDTNIVEGATYSYAVTAYDAAGNVSGTSTPSAITVPDTTRPSAPTLAVSTTIGTKHVMLTWDGSTDNIAVLGYKIYKEGTQIGDVASSTFADDNVAYYGSYHYIVDAYDAAGNVSDPSNIASATVMPSDTLPPTTPATLTATSTKTGAAKLSWGVSKDNVGLLDYRVYRDGTFIATTSTRSYTNTDSALLALHSYIYMVRAEDAIGNLSSSSPIATALIPDTVVPSAPASLTASATSTPPSVTLTWLLATDNIGVAGYNLYRTSVYFASTTLLTYTDAAGLIVGTTYGYKVRAYDAAGNLGAVKSVSIKVK